VKLPRDVTGDRLIRALVRLGYDVIRQTGSHVRLRHDGPPVHAVTVPLHQPIKTGTLHGILKEVARMRSLNLEFLIDSL
jgi:predicted RNA binding protein YcfA (HicA-like mRNA interferase family)